MQAERESLLQLPAEQDEIIAESPADPVPETATVGIPGKDHRVTLRDAACPQRCQSPIDEFPSEAGTSVMRLHGEMVEIASSTITPAEDRSDEALAASTAPAEAGIVFEKPRERRTIVG